MPRGNYERPPAKAHFSTGGTSSLCGLSGKMKVVRGDERRGDVTCLRCLKLLGRRRRFEVDRGCSAVAIEKLTGLRVDDRQRTAGEVIFAVEDAGYERDLTLTRVWRDRPAYSLVGVVDAPLALVFVAGHVMAFRDDRLHGVNGHGNEPITLVATFAKK